MVWRAFDPPLAGLWPPYGGLVSGGLMSGPRSLQASSDSSPVSERPRTTVSVGALHLGLQCWHAAASAFRHLLAVPRFRLNVTAVGRSQLMARWSGTHARIFSGIQWAAQTVLGVYLKRTCSRVTNASSALGVLNDYALSKSTHSLTQSDAGLPISIKKLGLGI